MDGRSRCGPRNVTRGAPASRTRGVSGRDACHSLVVLCCSDFLVFAAGGVPPSVGFLVPPSLSAVLGLAAIAFCGLRLGLAIALCGLGLGLAIALCGLGLPLSLKSVAYQPEPLSRNPDAETSRRRPVWRTPDSRSGPGLRAAGWPPSGGRNSGTHTRNGHREALRSRMRSP